MNNVLATMCYIDNGDSFLMLKRTKKENDIHEGLTISVGGKFEPGESPEDCVIREVKEETGLSVHVDGLAGTWQYRKRNGQFLNGVIYTATATRQEVMISSEHTDYAWVRPDELNQYPIHASLHTALRQMEKIPAFSSELLKEFLTAPREAARE